MSAAPAAAGRSLDEALAGTIFAGGAEIHAELGSTIDLCRRLAEEGAPEGRVVIARAQAAGRGQPGRSWHSPEGGLYLSALARPRLPARAAPILGTITGLAACEALRSLAVPCRLKLPNDLVAVHRGAWRKLGGMLVDTAIQGDALRHAVLSLGVNVRLDRASLPEALGEIAVSCEELAPGAASPDAIAAAFLRGLDSLLGERLEDEAVRERIAARHALHVRVVGFGTPSDGSDA